MSIPLLKFAAAIVDHLGIQVLDEDLHFDGKPRLRPKKRLNYGRIYLNVLRKRGHGEIDGIDLV